MNVASPPHIFTTNLLSPVICSACASGQDAGGASNQLAKMCMPSDRTKRTLQHYDHYAVIASITFVMAALEVGTG